jgi:hypothetical protein
MSITIEGNPFTTAGPAKEDLALLLVCKRFHIDLMGLVHSDWRPSLDIKLHFLRAIGWPGTSQGFDKENAGSNESCMPSTPAFSTFQALEKWPHLRNNLGASTSNSMTTQRRG